MNVRSGKVSRAYGGGAMAVFGAAWLLSSAIAMPASYLVLVVAIAILATALLTCLAVKYARAPGTNEPENGDVGPDTPAWLFPAIFGVEICAINIAVAVLIAHRHPEYLVPAVAAIVGLHFLPLARVFAFPPYYVTGTVLMIAGTIAGLTLWNAAACVVCAATLWTTSAVVLLRRAETQPRDRAPVK